MENKQTAVEWLVYELERCGYFEINDRFPITFEQAKQMEKEQIIEAFDCDGTPQPGEVWISNGELYYNETYSK